MNSWRNTIYFVSVFATILSMTSEAKSATPSCPSGTSPVTKQRFDTITASQKIPTIINWLSMENFALNNSNDAVKATAAYLIRNPPQPPDTTFVAFPMPFRINKDPQKNFPSALRAKLTQNRVLAVGPDGYGSLRVIRDGELTNENYSESIFYEVKAVRNGVLKLSYPLATSKDPKEPNTTFDSYQILGMLEVLSQSPASRTDKVLPELFFLTTSDVTVPSETTAKATMMNVAIWQSILCEYPITPPITPANPVTVRMSAPMPLNRQVYEAYGLNAVFNLPAKSGHLLNPRP